MIGKIFFKRALVGATALTVSLAGVVGTAATGFAATPTASSAAPSAGATDAASRAGRFVKLLIADTAKETGLDGKTIRNRLGAGQSLDKIAGDSATAVENDVMGTLKDRLDKAVASGKITQAKEDAALAKARPALETVMSADLSKYFSHSNKDSQAF